MSTAAEQQLEPSTASGTLAATPPPFNLLEDVRQIWREWRKLRDWQKTQQAETEPAPVVTPAPSTRPLAHAQAACHQTSDAA
ncbi:hypothetical protein ACIQUG_05180 [Ensifer sp. NPDC090286]|uniref:hypothetical protein n=1 Tax=Ensifer sp. NPDC090286 TaxID=3363991 RepID=UPI003839DF46